jgi:NitT/TauT family transport system substrate-binding protein
VIRAFFDAEYQIEQHRRAAKLMIGGTTRPTWPACSPRRRPSRRASTSATSGVHVRSREEHAGFNYISKDPDQDFVNFKLLEAVIKESPELWKRVKVHSKTS